MTDDYAAPAARKAGGVKPYYEAGGITIYHGDALEVLASLPDGSVSLSVNDPPYFRVVEEAFDRQWPSAEAFLEWLESVSAQWQRTLAPNGSLYCFCWPAMSARVEVMLSKRFEILNTITWDKAGRSGRAEKEALRCFFPDSERVIFAEQFGADGSALRGSGYAAADAESRAGVFEPLRAYLVGERDRAGITNRQVDECLGRNGMAGHYFGASQWAMPTADVYEKLRALFNAGKAAEFLRRDYEFLRRDYEGLRRPFATTARLPFSDVWTHPIVPASVPDRHPCEKPISMLRDIITISTREGGAVLDSFMGGGTALRAAKDLGRTAIGIDSDEWWCEVAARRLAQEVLL